MEGLDRVRFKAAGDKGEPVIVVASHEVLQDKGEDAVLQKASDKYDAGQLDSGQVKVWATDF